jgi:hypothetical protein
LVKSYIRRKQKEVLKGEKMVFILLVVVIVAIIIVVKVVKKKNSLAGLKSSGGYDIALKIKDALIQAGYEVPWDSILYYEGNHSGYWFYVKQNSIEIGEVRYDYHGGYKSGIYDLYKLDDLRKKNAEAQMIYQGGYYYAIYNDNLNLMVQSKQRTQEIPPFFEIAVRVMIGSGYEFHHPKWMFENPESAKYLNVMFQG